jgi:hypothetical protein
MIRGGFYKTSNAGWRRKEFLLINGQLAWWNSWWIVRIHVNLGEQQLLYVWRHGPDMIRLYAACNSWMLTAFVWEFVLILNCKTILVRSMHGGAKQESNVAHSHSIGHSTPKTTLFNRRGAKTRGSRRRSRCIGFLHFSLSLSLLVCLSVLLHVDDTVSRCVLAAHDSL